MVEMTIGSRFYYKDKLYEVVENERGYTCKGCVFLVDLSCKCKKPKCYSTERHDRKPVYFREVED